MLRASNLLEVLHRRSRANRGAAAESRLLPVGALNLGDFLGSLGVRQTSHFGALNRFKFLPGRKKGIVQIEGVLVNPGKRGDSPMLFKDRPWPAVETRVWRLFPLQQRSRFPIRLNAGP